MAKGIYLWGLIGKVEMESAPAYRQNFTGQEIGVNNVYFEKRSLFESVAEVKMAALFSPCSAIFFGVTMKAIALVLVTLLWVNAANADETGRQKKIEQIMEAQGLQQTLKEQLDQSKAEAAEHGRAAFKKILLELGSSEDKPDPKLVMAFTSYLEKCKSMWSDKEFVDIWSKNYGRGLTDSDLNQILAYYKSASGKKDVMASKAALGGFYHEIQEKGLVRMNASIAEMVADMKATATTK